MSGHKTYIQVILPLRFRETVTYSIPEEMVDGISVGSRVNVMLGYRKYKGYVEEITSTPRYDVDKIRDIISVDREIVATQNDISFWRKISEYYMCSLGEALKAATPFLMELTTKRVTKSANLQQEPIPPAPIPTLTEPQQGCLSETLSHFSKSRTVLLNGTTCSGKGEIYLHLSQKYLSAGKSVLVLVPDIPSCRAMERHFSKHFTSPVLTYHSGQSTAKRRNTVNALLNSKDGSLIIGLRSALFLPLHNLGLIVVDNEHDPLYKQSEPTPRYNGRDTALLLAQQTKANILLGSATPSFESLHNALSGKFAEVKLESVHPSCNRAKITVIDFLKESKLNSVKGPLSNIAISAIREQIQKQRKAVIYRPKWAFPQTEEGILEIQQALAPTDVDIYDEIVQIESLKYKPSLIVLLQGESLINARDFRSEEKAIQTIIRLSSIVQRGKFDGELIVQTSVARHNAFRYLAGKTDILPLITERESIALPPFYRLIKLVIKDNDPTHLQAKGEEIAEILSKFNTESILGPIPFSSEEGEQLIFQVSLKKGGELNKIKKGLAKALYNYNNLIVDVDPL